MSYALRARPARPDRAGELLCTPKLSCGSWRFRNTETGEWCTFPEDDLLDRFARNQLTFLTNADDCNAFTPANIAAPLDRDLVSYPAELVALAQRRVQYLKEIERHQPIGITSANMEPLIQRVSERIGDTRPSGWRTVSRDYRKWLNANRDIRAIMLRHSDRGARGPRMHPEVTCISDEVIEELYMTPERKRVPEVHLEIVRRLADINQFRPTDPLPIPSRRTIYREIARRSPYEVMVARYGKHRAEMEFRISGAGPQRPARCSACRSITLLLTLSSWMTPACCRSDVLRSPQPSTSTRAARWASMPVLSRRAACL